MTRSPIGTRSAAHNSRQALFNGQVSPGADTAFSSGYSAARGERGAFSNADTPEMPSGGRRLGGRGREFSSPSFTSRLQKLIQKVVMLFTGEKLESIALERVTAAIVLLSYAILPFFGMFILATIVRQVAPITKDLRVLGLPDVSPPLAVPTTTAPAISQSFHDDVHRILESLKEQANVFSAELQAMKKEQSGKAPETELKERLDQASETLHKKLLDLERRMSVIDESGLIVDGKLELMTQAGEKVKDVVPRLMGEVESIKVEVMKLGSVTQRAGIDEGGGDGRTSCDGTQNSEVLLQEVRQQIHKEIHLDGTGRIDWAQASLGAQIDTQYTSAELGTTSLAEYGMRMISSLNSRYKGIAAPVGKPADIVIGGPASASEGLLLGGGKSRPGDCFAFRGGEGQVTIRLPKMLKVTGVQIDHIAREMTPDPTTAPRLLEVFIDSPEPLPSELDVGSDLLTPKGWVGKSYSKVTGYAKKAKDTIAPPEPGRLVGSFAFDYLTNFQQYMPLSERSLPPTRRIRFKFLSNYGGRHTCIYRLRVHGTPVSAAGSS